MDIYYKYATSDHIHVGITLNLSNVPDMSKTANSCTRCKLDWSRIKQDDIHKYSVNTNTLLQNVNMTTDALLSRNAHCNGTQHLDDLCSFHEDIIKALKLASQPLYYFPKCNCQCRPG
jgi:hypothetical protein